ncbi:dehydration-induced 19 [Gossypium australe]|uniref:Dehydration-induced 19 n=1 Tax=Gossypium australe TaxID=47621 RepID=A0A5B6UCA3_9ROSI|nr:dehydration-induced 19 [Gossypium australe]
MDSDFWTSRLAAAKRQYNLQHRHQTSHLDEVRPDFPCPYCYEDFDIASLCSHLEDDHPCESKVVERKMIGIEISSFSLLLNWDYLQRRCRLRRVAIPNSQALSLLGRDLREAHLQVLLGGGAYRSSGVNVSNANAATDSFLSSLIMNFPASEAEEITKSVVTSFEDTATKNMAPAHMRKPSLDPSLSYEEREKRIRQAMGRAGFVQDLLLTTLLND